MTVLQLGDISVQRIVEHEIPVYHPADFFDEATAEAVEPYREWLEPKALCPRTGRIISICTKMLRDAADRDNAPLVFAHRPSTVSLMVAQSASDRESGKGLASPANCAIQYTPPSRL